MWILLFWSIWEGVGHHSGDYHLCTKNDWFYNGSQILVVEACGECIWLGVLRLFLHFPATQFSGSNPPFPPGYCHQYLSNLILEKALFAFSVSYLGLWYPQSPSQRSSCYPHHLVVQLQVPQTEPFLVKVCWVTTSYLYSPTSYFSPCGWNYHQCFPSPLLPHPRNKLRFSQLSILCGNHLLLDSKVARVLYSRTHHTSGYRAARSVQLFVSCQWETRESKAERRNGGCSRYRCLTTFSAGLVAKLGGQNPTVLHSCLSRGHGRKNTFLKYFFIWINGVEF